MAGFVALGAVSIGEHDVFLHDRETGRTVLVSAAEGGEAANGASDNPVVSEDGAKVAFVSAASNLVADDRNDRPDVFGPSRGETQRARRTRRAAAPRGSREERGRQGSAPIAPRTTPGASTGSRLSTPSSDSGRVAGRRQRAGSGVAGPVARLEAVHFPPYFAGGLGCPEPRFAQGSLSQPSACSPRPRARRRSSATTAGRPAAAGFQAGFVAGEMAAVRLVPSGPCPVSRVRFLFGGSQAIETVTLHVWDDSAGTATPGAELFADDFEIGGIDDALLKIDLAGRGVTVNGPFRA